MPRLTLNDTIAAIATPSGEGAIAIVRISGPAALSIANTVFRGSQPLIEVPGYTVHHGHVEDASGDVVDEVLATVFRQPKSYTGEDSVELSCHGGTLVTHSVLRVVLEAGARQAEPGEFTKRAFLNGRMDLSKAEAVADLIAAKGVRALRSSLQQLEGRLGGRISTLRQKVIDLCALLELDLDFAEDGLEVIDSKGITARIGEVDRDLRDMEDSFSLGRLYREGVSVVLAGEPNAGKSSLFNALLKEDRAIVTEVPGTTRDTLQEELEIGGVVYSFTDTAGLRDTDDLVEKEGVSRSRSAIRSSDVIIVVVDACATRDREEALVHFRALHPSQMLIVAYNKVDLLNSDPRVAERFIWNGIKGSEVFVSARSGIGMDRLKDALATSVRAGGLDSEVSVILTNRRHLESVRKARGSLLEAHHLAEKGTSNELVAFEARQAAESLAEITGEVSSDTVLNEIFSRFCIGK